MDTHTALVQRLYTRLQRALQNNNIEIDGGSLDIPSVVAVSWFVTRQTAKTSFRLIQNLCSHDIAPTISTSPEFIQRIDDSVALLYSLLHNGDTIYGQSSFRIYLLIW